MFQVLFQSTYTDMKVVNKIVTKSFYKPVGFYGPIAPPVLNAPSSECPPKVVPNSDFRTWLPRSRIISERAPFWIYEHAQCRIFERTSLQRAYVVPCRQQMGSTAVQRARRSALVLAARTGVSRPYLHYGDREADFKMYLLCQFCSNRVEFF